MSSDIISCLQLDKHLPSRIIVVKEINGCDSSFIDSCVLSHCIKNEASVIVVSTHNSLNHFQNVGLKMNYNLQKHIESGLIGFYNLAEESVNSHLTNGECSIQGLLLKIKEKILEKQQIGEVNIILDGVSHLFDMQYTLKEVNDFVKQIFDLIKQSNNSFLLCHCNDASEYDITHTMVNLLIHKAHTVLETETLQSGWSTDVAGHLTVKYPGEKFSNEHKFTLNMKTTKYLFKLFDRGVKLLAPGTV